MGETHFYVDLRRTPTRFPRVCARARALQLPPLKRTKRSICFRQCRPTLRTVNFYRSIDRAVSEHGRKIHRTDLRINASKKILCFRTNPREDVEKKTSALACKLDVPASIFFSVDRNAADNQSSSTIAGEVHVVHARELVRTPPSEWVTALRR